MIEFDVIIPARLQSTRFPRKLLHEFYGLPMLEHVRRRALLINGVRDVIVATCDKEIFELVISYGGRAMMTSDGCDNGTERISEASNKLNSKYIILLQGDEPCFYPDNIENLIKYVLKTEGIFYNLVSPISDINILTNKSSVKCSVNEEMNITSCFRTTPFISSFIFQKQIVKKLLGIMCFERKFLSNFRNLKVSKLSKEESIEQLKLLENKVLMQAVEVKKDIPSLNIKEDIKILENEFNLKVQQKILQNIL